VSVSRDRIRRRLALSLLSLGLAAWSTAGCRSAAPAATAGPALSPPPVAHGEHARDGSPVPAPTPVVPPSEAPAGPPPAALLEAEAPAAGLEEGTEPAEEGSETGPDEVQKEALDLCQSASELLHKGERERAIEAIDQAYQRMLSLPDNGDDSFLQARDDIRQLIAGLLREAYQKQLAPPSPSWDLGVPIVDNEHVRREIKSFTTVERGLFLEGYRRSGRYRPMILAKLKAANLPSQLSWLPLVESWFKVRAFSRAGAMGLWQFIASTALRYGMSRDGWIDERMDPEKSTDAAIAYLAALHGSFGDWPKALAAYNCGEARVLRLQARSKDQYLDFWDLYEQLPLETRRYVPRFIAALLIIQHPADYGITLPEPLAPVDHVATIKTAKPVALADLEGALGLAKDSLKELNPELRFAATPAREYGLRVPAEHAESASAQVAQLKEWKPPRPAFVIHRVRRGQTLGAIARHYHTTIRAIQTYNHLRSVNRLRVGQRLRIPLRR
jgi:membrane-bound lytic murein transglycosylase D